MLWILLGVSVLLNLVLSVVVWVIVVSVNRYANENHWMREALADEGYFELAED